MSSSEYMDFKKHSRAGTSPRECPDCGAPAAQKHAPGCATLARLMGRYNQDVIDRLGPLNQLDAAVEKVCQGAR